MRNARVQRDLPGTLTVIVDAPQWTPEQFAQAQCITCETHPFEDVTLGGCAGDSRPESLQPLEDVIQGIQFE